MGITIEFVQGEADPDLVVVRADGTILIDGRQGSQADAEAALRANMSGVDLDRALAALRNLTTRH